MKKGVMKVPTIYQLIRERLYKHSDSSNMLSYSEVRKIISWHGISYEYWNRVMKELFDYNIITRINQRHLKISGPKKNLFWNNSC